MTSSLTSSRLAEEERDRPFSRSQDETTDTTTQTDSARTNLKNLLPHELAAWFGAHGEKPFRARQLVKWLYQKYEQDFLRMTDLSGALRERLNTLAVIPGLDLVTHQRAVAGDTEKFLFRLPDGNTLETVLMHFDDHLGPGRATLCISTQVGCAMGCVFCASGQSGVLRNLETWEIVDQVLSVQRLIASRGERIANVVYMGIGEPLANYTNTIRSVKILNHEEGLAIGMRHIAISTSGLVPAMLRLGLEKLPLRLAISLHAANNELRSALMPVNKLYPLERLIAACHTYQQQTGRRITFEYCCIRDINDSDADAHAVGRLLEGVHALLNIIPLNPVEGYNGQRPAPARVHAFQQIIESYGIKTTVRQTMGVDIAAACGQLRRNETQVIAGRTIARVGKVGLEKRS